MSARFDWIALMTAGVRGLGLRPADFWALTPAELAFMMGEQEGRHAMTRSTLDALVAQFPDMRNG